MSYTHSNACKCMKFQALEDKIMLVTHQNMFYEVNSEYFHSLLLTFI